MTLRTRRITSYAIFVSPNQSRTVRGEGNRHFEGRTAAAPIPNEASVMEGDQSRSGYSQLPTALPVLQRRKQRWQHLQLQHTTQLLIYADPLPLDTVLYSMSVATLGGNFWDPMVVPQMFYLP